NPYMTGIPLPRTVRIVVLLLCTALASALGYGVYLLSRLAPIGTAYAAKTLCSGVFVSRRGEQDVIREDVRADNHPLLRVIHASWWCCIAAACWRNAMRTGSRHTCRCSAGR